MSVRNTCEILEHATNDSFVRYLGKRLGLDEVELPKSGEWSTMGSTIGALALRLNALNLDQVDEILERQENSREKKLFGALAVELGYLTPDQVNRLLEIQHLARQFELAAQLTLSGKIEMPELLQHLHDYAAETKTFSA